MSDVTEVSRGEGASAAEQVKADIIAKLEAAAQKASLELTQTGDLIPGADWEVWAWGPFQTPGSQPGRIINVGETAYVGVGVWMNAAMLQEMEGFHAHIALNFYTSDMQRMKDVPSLTHQCVIHTSPNGADFSDGLGGGVYLMVWEFEPSEQACLYQTNVCARILNCAGLTVPGYAGFVRQVFDFDPGHLYQAGLPNVVPGWQTNNPIRFMVANLEEQVDLTTAVDC